MIAMSTVGPVFTTWVYVYGWAEEIDAPTLIVNVTADRAETACQLATEAAEEFADAEVCEDAEDREPRLWVTFRCPVGALPPTPDEHAAVLHVTQPTASN